MLFRSVEDGCRLYLEASRCRESSRATEWRRLRHCNLDRSREENDRLARWEGVDGVHPERHELSSRLPRELEARLDVAGPLLSLGVDTNDVDAAGTVGYGPE